MTFRHIPSALSLSLLFLSLTGSAQDPTFLSGYGRDMEGEVLSYWSFHPFAKQSLLTRATTGSMTITWETQAVPAARPSGPVSFLWIGAYSSGTSSTDHEFDLVIDGRDTMTFVTRAGGVTENWSVRSRAGATLIFTHVWTDHVNDAHGYFTLAVPRSMVTVGRPLRLSVTGRRSPTRDWYMTFRYAVRESALVRSLPIVLRHSGGLRQPIEVSIDAPFEHGSAVVAVGEQPPSTHDLKLGWNSIEVLSAAVERATEIPVAISINGGPVRRQTAVVRPVTRRTIYLLPHSHNDIGYSDLQTKVSRIQLQNLRDALRLADASRSYPEGSRFRWNVEILWPIDSLLKNGSPVEIQSFVQAVRRGDIGLNALYVNPLTGISRPEALMHLTDVARELRTSFGLDVRTAMISDIPGYSWGIVPALAHAGVRYFTSGPNSGDRIGHFGVAWGDKPFYWRSPSGQDSLLVWVAGTGYSMFHASRELRHNDGFRLKLCDYLERLDAQAYPYEIVQMRYSIYSDNGMTDSTLSGFVRDWNDRTVTPALRIATADEMFADFERRYGAHLPSFSGDLTPYWEDGAVSTATEVGAVIRASERLVQAEIAASMIDATTVKPETFDDAWDAINLWNEHTWGAWNSVSDPDHPEAVAQWEMKKDYAVKAAERSEQAWLSVAGSRSSDTMFEVMNTSTWERTDLVTLSAEESRAGDHVVDEAGKPVLSQRLSTGELAFRADNIPPMGARRYRVTSGRGRTKASATSAGTSLETSRTAVRIDPTTGSIVSIRDKGTSREIVASDGMGANAVLYVDGTDPARTISLRTSSHGLKEAGPLLVSYVTEGTITGRATVTREVRLIDGVDRVEIINTIDKSAVREKEALYFGFDWNVPDPTTRMDLGWGIIRPEVDQLPGSCKDYFSVQRWVDVSNASAGVTWALAEAPLVSLAGPVDERRHNEGPAGWRSTAASSARWYSYVMNNYWHTNYKADQAGVSRYRFAVRAHQSFDPVEAYRFGIEWNQPLLVRRVASTSRRPALPFMIRSNAVTATSIRPARDGNGWIVRLFNPSTSVERVEIGSISAQSKAAFRSSLLEDQGRPLGRTTSLTGFEILTVRIEEP